MKAWKKWMKEGKLQRDTPCQAVGPRPGCNGDHLPGSVKPSLLPAPLFDHEPGCSSSSMWKYLVCCRRECLGKEIGRLAFLQPYSPVLPTFPGVLPVLELHEGLWDLSLFLCFLLGSNEKRVLLCPLVKNQGWRNCWVDERELWGGDENPFLL